jgi:hypothetical protein
MSTKPDIATLTDYLYGELSPERHREVAQWLERDPELAAELASLQSTRQWLHAAADVIPEPAPVLVLPPRRSRWQTIGWAAAACWLVALTGYVALRPAPAALPEATQPVVAAATDTAWLRTFVAAQVPASPAPRDPAFEREIARLRAEIDRAAKAQELSNAAYNEYLVMEMTRILREERARDLAAIQEAFRLFAIEQQDARQFDDQRFATLFAKIQHYEHQTAFAP